MSGRWARVTAAFEAALARPAAEREAFVSATLADDPAAVAEVLSLLEHHERADGFLAEAAAVAARRHALSPDAVGERFGDWRVTDVLGEGGMGVVYRAEREGGDFRQDGALKLIRSPLPTAELVERFRRERRILATLEHPNIARLLDGGSTAQGLPFLVMEFVGGQPLYEYCSDQALALEPRLRLFLDVCAAVQYAHQHLVLHRDLKPGNVLVTADGQPKLLDFGIARMLADDEGNAVTLTRQAPMTPEYASPEQLGGQPATTASDVYSLGVVLYELLTGARPYAPTGDPQELLQRVIAQDPERPSTAVTRATPAATAVTTGGARRLPAPPAGALAVLRRRLSGDLDNVVLRAMHRESAQRYPTVERLADDLRRYLAGRTVRARPDTWRYRTSRFVRRNRVAVAAGAITLLALVGGLGVALWQASVARHQHAAAERRGAEQRALANALLFEIDGALSDVPGATRARELLLTRTEQYLEKLWRDRSESPELRGELADAYAHLGELQGQMWSANTGHGDLAYHSMQRALELSDGLWRERPDDPARLARLLAALTAISNFERFHARTAPQLEHQLRAVEVLRRALVVAPDSTRFRHGLPRAEHNLGLAYFAAGRDSEAFAMTLAAQHDFEALVARNPADTLERIALSQAVFGYAGDLLEHRPAALAEAVAQIRRSMGMQEALLRAGRTDVQLRRLYAGNLHLLAAVASEHRSQPDTAVAYEQRAMAIMAELAARDPGNRGQELSLAKTRINLGILLAQADRPGEALPVLHAELARARTWLRADSANAEYGSSVSECLSGLGAAYEAQARGSARGSAAARENWHAAREGYAASAASLAHWAARGDEWSADSTRRALAGAHVAACDSALRAVATNR